MKINPQEKQVIDSPLSLPASVITAYVFLSTSFLTSVHNDQKYRNLAHTPTKHTLVPCFSAIHQPNTVLITNGNTDATT